MMKSEIWNGKPKIPKQILFISILSFLILAVSYAFTIKGMNTNFTNPEFLFSTLGVPSFFILILLAYYKTRLSKISYHIYDDGYISYKNYYEVSEFKVSATTKYSTTHSIFGSSVNFDSESAFNFNFISIRDTKDACEHLDRLISRAR